MKREPALQVCATDLLVGAFAMGAVLVLGGGIGSLSAQSAPQLRAHHEIVYDADRGRVYLIGGSTREGDGYRYFNDIWSWNGPAWSLADSLPFPRSSHRVVYHSQRRSLILFGGGFDRTFAGDNALWEWRGGEWRRLAGAHGAGRSEHGMCYDRRRARIVIFGGWDSANEFSAATWEWDQAALTEIDVAGPSPRAGHAFVYDPNAERCLLFGGRDSTGLVADTWTWDGEEWRRLDVTGPSPRWFFGAATDDTRGRVVIFGGSGPDGDLADTWVWHGDSWELLMRDGPPARGSSKLAFDGSNVVLFGGRRQKQGGFRDLNDSWELRGGSWVRRSR